MILSPKRGITFMNEASCDNIRGEYTIIFYDARGESIESCLFDKATATDFNVVLPFINEARTATVFDFEGTVLIKSFRLPAPCNANNICEIIESADTCPADCTQNIVVVPRNLETETIPQKTRAEGNAVYSSIGYLAVGGALIGVYYFIRRFREPK